MRMLAGVWDWCKRLWRATDWIDKALFLWLVVLVGRIPTDFDFGWQLRSGLDLLKNLRIPMTDPYSHTLPNYAWVNHEWLSEGIMAFIYQHTGMAVIVLLFALLTIAAFWLAMSGLRLNRKTKLLAIAAVFLADQGRWGVRMQFITLFAVAVVIWLFQQYRQGRLKHLWWCVPIFLLWANLHGGFTLGLGVLGMLTFVELIKWWAHRHLIETPSAQLASASLSLPQIGHLILVILCSAIVTLVNPYGWRLYYDFYNLFQSSFALQHVGEWRPLFNAFHSTYGAWLVAYFVLFSISAIVVARKVDFSHWILTLTLLIAAWLATRNISFFLLVSIGFVAEALEYVVRPIAELVARHRWLIVLPVGLVGILITSWHIWPLISHADDISAIAKAKYYPLAAIDWAKAHPDKIGTTLYNTYTLGGFLDWQFPQQKVFVDGRMAYWQEGNKYPFRDAIDIDRANPDAIDIMQTHYGIDWVITDKLFPLSDALKQDAGWETVYSDDIAAIYRKK